MFEDPVKEKKYLKIALGGDAGSGKTLFALSFPKVAIIDGERGTDPYRGKRQFKSFRANRWGQLEAPIKWLKNNPGVFETLVIDPMTIFYFDLIRTITDYIKNKRGNEIMTSGDWGVEKRKFAALLNDLIDLNMHVILCFREKAEYEEIINGKGEEVRRKTGNFLLEADKQVRYLFDLSLRCFTEVGKAKKEGSVKFKIQVDKSRYNDWMPLYSVHDITEKLAFDELFASHVGEMLDAPDAAPSNLPNEPFVIVDEPVKTEKEKEDKHEKKLEVARKEAAIDDKNAGDGIAKMMATFAGPAPKYEDFPFVTADNLKVLFTLVGEMTWPDNSILCRAQRCQNKKHEHPEFTAEQAKAMIKEGFGVDSAKDLRTPHAAFLINEFNKVMQGKSWLDLGTDGVPYVATEVPVPAR